MAKAKSTSRAHEVQRSLKTAFRKRERVMATERRSPGDVAAKMPIGRRMLYCKSDIAAILSISQREVDHLIAVGRIEGFRAKVEGVGWRFLIHPNSIMRAIAYDLRALPSTAAAGAEIERLGRALEFLTGR